MRREGDQTGSRVLFRFYAKDPEFQEKEDAYILRIVGGSMLVDEVYR
jgi:hypothetical protein